IGLPHRDTLGPPRAATQDVEVADVRIRTDEAVHVSHATANRAPGAFPAPETVGFARHPNPRAASGSGRQRRPVGTSGGPASETLPDARADRAPGPRL